MEPENIDWNNIESIFVEDNIYEYINAPKWVDLSAPGEPVDDDEAWFCNSHCKHPKTAEDFLKSTRNSKVKLLRSVTISEILPFRDRNGRDVKLKGKENKASSIAYNENSENKNPNFSTPPLSGKRKWNKPGTKPITEKTKQRDDTHANSSKQERKPRLKSTFSARNLVAGREILNQITDFCAELKRLAKKGSKKGSSEKGSGGIVGELKERARERETMPLLVVKESEV